MNIRLTIITLLIYTSIAMVIFFTIKGMTVNKVQAAVFPRELTVNDAIYYSDSSAHATSRLWEFGSNNNQTSRAKGYYRFRQPGKYLVKLTINNQLADTFLINVKPVPKIKYDLDTAFTIYASATGIAGQNVLFKIRGANVSFAEWYFGESGKIDSRDIETFHSYSAPGKYEVKLVTDLNQNNPIYHTITISPAYTLKDNVITTEAPAGGGGGGGSDLKQYLQKIASGGNFDKNYHYIIDHFLCNNTHVAVTTNGKGGNDFYSYCQNLQLNSGITIDNAATETDPKTGCVNKLIITQH